MRYLNNFKLFNENNIIIGDDPFDDEGEEN